MKWIKKTLPPKDFQMWMLKEKNLPKKWIDLPSKEMPLSQRETEVYYYSKSELRTFLANEQSFECGYCNRIVADDYTSPIEHLHPRTEYPALIFDYYNLILSCDGNVKRKTDKAIHCDHLKGKNEIPLFPIERNCQKHFVFDEFGNIYSKSSKGKETIKAVGLDCTHLRNRRKELLEEIVFDNNNQYYSSQDYKNKFLKLMKINEIDFKPQILQVLKLLMNRRHRKECELAEFSRCLISWFMVNARILGGVASYLYLKSRINNRKSVA